MKTTLAAAVALAAAAALHAQDSFVVPEPRTKLVRITAEARAPGRQAPGCSPALAEQNGISSLKAILHPGASAEIRYSLAGLPSGYIFFYYSAALNDGQGPRELIGAISFDFFCAQTDWTDSATVSRATIK